MRETGFKYTETQVETIRDRGDNHRDRKCRETGRERQGLQNKTGHKTQKTPDPDNNKFFLSLIPPYFVLLSEFAKTFRLHFCSPFFFLQDGAFLIRHSSAQGGRQPYTLAVLYQQKVFNIPIRFLGETRGYALGKEGKKNEEVGEGGK